MSLFLVAERSGAQDELWKGKGKGCVLALQDFGLCCSQSSFDQLGLRLKLKEEYRWDSRSQPLETFSMVSFVFLPQDKCLISMFLPRHPVFHRAAVSAARTYPGIQSNYDRVTNSQLMSQMVRTPGKCQMDRHRC